VNAAVWGRQSVGGFMPGAGSANRLFDFGITE